MSKEILTLGKISDLEQIDEGCNNFNVYKEVYIPLLLFIILLLIVGYHI